MKSFLVLCLVVLVFGAVQSQNQNFNPQQYQNNIYPGKTANILRYENNVRTNGYDFRFETDDPIVREETGNWEGTGEYEPTGEQLGINRVNGYAYYNLGDGTPFSITFDADNYGYRPRFVIGNAASSGASARSIGSASAKPIRPPYSNKK